MQILQKILKQNLILYVRPLPRGLNKKVIELMKDKLGRKIMIKSMDIID